MAEDRYGQDCNASVASFTPACLGCLRALDTPRGQTPPIEPCLSDGVVYEAPFTLECYGDNARFFLQLDSAQTFSNAWYGHNADCQWRLDCPSGSTVELQFNSFDIENNFDYVYVFDAPAVDASAQLGRYTGTSLPPTTVSTGNSMTVQLTSDGSVALEGFSASYSCAAAPSPPPSSMQHPCIDVDGDGNVDALTDILMVMRYMFGFSGTALTNNAIAEGATRTNPADIETYLDSLIP